MFTLVCSVLGVLVVIVGGEIGMCVLRACNRARYKTFWRAFKDEVKKA